MSDKLQKFKLSFNLNSDDFSNKSTTSDQEGIYKRIATEDDLKACGFSAHDRDAVGKVVGRTPNDYKTCSPARWGGGHELYADKWEQVTLVLKVKSIKFSAKEDSPDPDDVIFQSTTNDSDQTVTAHPVINKSFSTTIGHEWSIQHSFGFTQSVDYGFEFDGINAGGTTSINESVTFGESNEQSVNKSTSYSTSVDVPVAPGEVGLVTLRARRKSAVIVVEYEASLEGTVILNYEDPYQGAHFWFEDINKFNPTSVILTDTITVGYTANFDVDVTSKKAQRQKG